MLPAQRNLRLEVTLLHPGHPLSHHVWYSPWFSSVQFSCSVVSDYLQPHGLQHTRLPCPSQTARACSNSCWWCHPVISSSVIPFSSCLQSFPALGSFSRRQFFPSGGQSIGASASASVLPVNIQDWFPLGLTGLISLLSKGLSKVFPNTTDQKHQFSSQPSCFPCGSVGKESTCNAGDLGLIPGLGRSPGEGKGYPLQYSDLENSMDLQKVWHNWATFSLIYGPTHIHTWLLEKNHSFDYVDFCWPSNVSTF